MARHKGAPYYLRSVGGRAVLEYRTTEGQRKVRLGLPFDPERSSPAERRAAQQAAEDRYRELTNERVIVEHARVKTSLTFNELYGLYLDRWEPDPKLGINAKKKLTASLIVRRAYGATLMEWAGDEASRPDGTKRWRADNRTPLERIVADVGPADFLAWRLTRVKRKTMRKEKSNLAQFLAWAKAHDYIATVPPITLPPGGGVAAVKNTGRGVTIPISTLDARKLIAVMPEYSVGRTGPNGARRDRFLVRSFFEMLWLSGLRPVTLERLEVPRNWRRGSKSLRLDAADDKIEYARELPLTKMMIEVLDRVAPDRGHIFGFHDRDAYLRAACEIVFKDDPLKRELLGRYHLRHFVGTFLANRAGTSLPSAQFVLGHLDLTTTSGYVHADEAGARELLESAEAELRKAARAAEKWAKGRT